MFPLFFIMKVKRISSFYLGLFLSYICCSVAPNISVARTPVKEKQVDVITQDPPPGALGREKMTVDVREAVRDLRNNEMLKKASGVLHVVDNACLSSGTVNLLKTTLNDNSVEVRMRAINLLGLSRNPEAIEAISNRLQNAPSYRVRWISAVSLGRLAGETAVPALRVVLSEDKRIETAVINGLGYAGGKAVPLLIQMLKEDVKEGGSNANYFIQSLETNFDRRAIKPLLAIISHPTSLSDPNMSQVQLNAATVLAHFAMDWIYAGMLKSRDKFFAEDYPVTPRENRRVNASDRARIFEALKTAGYDINRLAERFWIVN
jgi:hypothetical protein